MSSLFPLGELYISIPKNTPLNLFSVIDSLHRHRTGDWGTVGERGRQRNDQAVLAGTCLLSSYRDYSGRDFWIVTTADRSSTTVFTQ